MKPASTGFLRTNFGAVASSPAQALLIKRAQADLLNQFLSYWRGALSALAVVTVTAYLAGRSRASPTSSAVWLACAFSNCCAQAAVCRAMELTSSPSEAMRRWLNWLLASILLNGVFWGSVPWLVMDAGVEAVWSAALLGLMLLFCIASSPGTWQMICIATMPIAVLGSSALLRSGTHFVWAAGFAGLVLLVAFYGLRLTAARVQGLVQRFAAEDLAAELEQKQAKLEVQQTKLIEVERERTLLLERQRLMRDMHDGLGASLVVSLAAARRGEANPVVLAAMLADCIDDLRAVIDSLEPSDHDLTTLLGSMRHRMDRRIQAAGIQLEWQIDDLPALPWMGPTEALQVMRIVQEVVTNSVKHSFAQHIRIAAQVRDACVEVCIADNGRGFDVDADYPGRGLSFLKQRVHGLGGTVEIRSTLAIGTTVKVMLPIGRDGSS
jgi:signal transduction histidine kinase